MDSNERVADGVLSCTLPRAEWTHEAHLRFAFDTIHRHGVERALEVSRVVIRNYNDATGLANTDTSGYHETLTVYYCAAVAVLIAGECTVDDVVTDLSVTRDAPLKYWDRAVLFGVEARLRWVDPVHVLPFPVSAVLCHS